MKMRIQAIILCISFIAIPIISSCGGSGNDEDLALLAAGEARVVLDIKMPGEEIASNGSILDRIFRLFTKNAVAQSTTPIFYIDVSVTGPGMAPSIGYFFPANQLSLDIPQGLSRKITVTAHVTPGGHTHVTTFTNSLTMDIVAGETNSASMTLLAGASKIFIPDYYNGRLIQIDDFSGAGWKTASVPGIMDIDIDGQGRIFTAGFINPYVSRLDNIDDATPTTISTTSGIRGITVDRINSIVYYITFSALYRNNLDGSAQVGPLTTTGLNNFRGLDVDENGLLYLACYDGSNYCVVQYNPSTQTVISSNKHIVSSDPRDVVVKSDYIYIANLNGGSDNLIIRIGRDFQSPVGFGTQVSSYNTAPGMFYGPRLFVATRNDGLYIIDEYAQSGNNYDKLVHIKDILGSNWGTFGSTGTGQAQFYFFEDSFC